MEKNNSEKYEEKNEIKTGKKTKSSIDSKQMKDFTGIPGICVKTKNPKSSSYLVYGSFYPRHKTKENWKQKYKDLQKENTLLRDELSQHKEEIHCLKYNKHTLLEMHKDIVEQLVHLRSENVQIGNHNSQVIHNYYEMSSVKDLIGQVGKLEDDLKEDTTEPLHLISQSQDMMELLKFESEKNNSDGIEGSFSSEMQQLSENILDTEMACPGDSIPQQITDLQGDFAKFYPFRKRVQSTVSLDERKSTKNDNKSSCRKKIHSEYYLNI